MRTHTRRSAEEWRTVIDEQSASALSAPQFCKQHNIGYASFCQWRKRLSQSSIPEPAQPVTNFVAVTPFSSQSEDPSWLVELELGSDIVLRVGKL